jgi:Macrocin-O-methyltransferase (TylF)
MIQLPDLSKAFEYENNFYLSCKSSRLSKILTHYELYKIANELEGAIVECGVFKGVSLSRFAGFRDLMNKTDAQKIIGFDIFGIFPATDFEDDKVHLEKFINDAGSESIDLEQLEYILTQKGLNQNIELIKGDINQTVPQYVAQNPDLKISMLNLDTDVYEPAVTILEHLYPKIVSGGLLVLDDYGVFPGETKAVDDYFAGRNITIHKFPFASTPCYIIKD